MNNRVKIKIPLLALAVILCATSTNAQTKKVLLSDMDLTKAYQAYGVPMKDKAVTGEDIKVAGSIFSKGVGVQSENRIKIVLMKSSTRFTCKVGVNDHGIEYNDSSLQQIPMSDGTMVFYRADDNKRQFIGVGSGEGKLDKGSVIFKILGDGKELFNSGIMNQGDAPKPVDISLNGIYTIELIVEDGGDGISGDHANWIDAEIEYLTILPSSVAPDYQGKVAEMDKKIEAHLKSKLSKLEHIDLPLEKADFDWLIDPDKAQANVYSSSDNKEIILSNGIVARRFRIFPNLATVDIINQMNGESLMRAVSSEGTVTIDGKIWNLGGLTGQTERGYMLDKWLDKLAPMPNSFFVEDFEVGQIKESTNWENSRWALNREMPTGKRLTFTLRGSEELANIVIKLHFDLYDKLPSIRKHMEVINEDKIDINLDSFKLESLAFTEPESIGQNSELPNISIESNYAMHGSRYKQANKCVNWVLDKAYTSQVDYRLNTPCIMEVSLPLGPDVAVTKDEPFVSIDAYIMPYDSYDIERKGLFNRRMYRTLAPWTTENPIFMHLISSKPEDVKNAIDQCAETGYEMVILSFGSGTNMEDTSAANYAKFKEFADYGRSKGVDIGSYSLLSSRWVSEEVDVINPETGKRGGMIFGSAPCLASDWGYDYFDKIRTFYEKTGFMVFENDGSYPGDVCASTTHAHHKGLNDSQWKQWNKIRELYLWMNSKGIFLNVPDYYFLSGQNKSGIGYREENWSLPREQQLILGRQANYRGTISRQASASWTFVPLTQYHGGGAAATIEPLDEHLYFYKAHMIQNYGAGVQACYRGPRLYDTERTKAMVIEVISWYKRYRSILNSDIIHMRFPDAKDWDGFVHVNPNLEEKGLAMLFNPLDHDITRTINLPLYYTGLTNSAQIRDGEGKSKKYKLNRDYSVDITITIPAGGYKWLVIEE